MKKIAEPLLTCFMVITVYGSLAMCGYHSVIVLAYALKFIYTYYAQITATYKLVGHLILVPIWLVVAILMTNISIFAKEKLEGKK
jgi:hypothetical protein